MAKVLILLALVTACASFENSEVTVDEGQKETTGTARTK